MKWVKIWLLSGCVLVYSMVLLGGITRLTGSGLSITEWNLLMGTLPPIGDVQWAETFSKYQHSPQFQKVNFDFTIQEFKSIFWWEYLHRLVGRLTGIVFILPFLYFIYRKLLSRELIRNGVFIFLLGGLQGALGWFMVKSGLVDDPRVSHFRLAAHLGTAFITFGFIFHVFLKVHFADRDRLDVKFNTHTQKLYKLAWVLLVVVFAQILYGAFTAGLHAGRIYNTFPKMGDSWMPEAVTALGGFWENITINLAGVQFVHRCLGWFIGLCGIPLIVYCYKTSDDKHVKYASIGVLLCISAQIILGILTLIYQVPIALGVLHQTGAFALFTSMLFLLNRLRARFA